MRDFSELSAQAVQFVEDVEKRMGIPVALIGTGPGASDIVDRR